MKKLTLAICMISTISAAYAQTKTKTVTKTPAGKTKTVTKSDGSNGGFQTTANGIDYKFVVDAAGNDHPKYGDYVEVNIATTVGDSVIFETKKVNNNQPVQFQVQQPQFKGDLVEGLLMMTPGDRAIFRLSVDTLKKAGTPMAPWMKPGTNQKITYDVELVSVKGMAEMQKEHEQKSAAQKGIDEKMLQDYFAKNNIKASRTESGLYYSIDKQGTGPKANMGDTVVVNYTGKTMDGKTFDSNVDPQFQHVQPFTFMVGMHQVIPGWDEGFTMLNQGTKGTLYIPSGLAYGERSPDPAHIPANSILIFDVELVDVKAAHK